MRKVLAFPAVLLSSRTGKERQKEPIRTSVILSKANPTAKETTPGKTERDSMVIPKAARRMEKEST